MIKLSQLDHLVLTVADIDVSCRFYSQVLGMEIISFGDNRKALRFGQQKINLHQHGNEFSPHAKQPLPGSADLCFVTDQPLDDVTQHLNNMKVSIEEGPLERTGATSSIISVYMRDPDGNLIEIANKK